MSIDVAMRLDALEKANAELRARLEALEAATGLFASDKDMGSQYGDPVVRLDLRDWRGPKCKGKRYSQCPAEFLDMLADYLAYSAANPKPGGEKYAKGNALDAKRARSWARRNRAGLPPAPAQTAAPQFPGDPVPSFDAPAFGAAAAWENDANEDWGAPEVKDEFGGPL